MYPLNHGMYLYGMYLYGTYLHLVQSTDTNKISCNQTKPLKSIRKTFGVYVI